MQIVALGQLGTWVTHNEYSHGQDEQHQELGKR